MTRTDDRSALASSLALAAVCGLLTVLVTIDLVSDVASGTTAFHAAIEGTVIAAGAVAAGWFALRVRQTVREARDLRDRARELAGHLDASRRETERWRREAGDLIAGLGAAIDQQLERWGLSPAEKDIALLLLKGLSHKEIAQARSVAETTVRQQARALYRKAGLAGRNELAAFFLEDLLAPRPGVPADPHPRPVEARRQ